jgi:hypothetical protein
MSAQNFTEPRQAACERVGGLVDQDVEAYLVRSERAACGQDRPRRITAARLYDLAKRESAISGPASRVEFLNDPLNALVSEAQRCRVVFQQLAYNVCVCLRIATAECVASGTL